MTHYAVWFVAGVALLIAELVTGTFYLFMVAIGCAAGGLVALAGAPLTLQVVLGAAVGCGAIIVLRRSRFGRVSRFREAGENPDVVLDIGQTVQVWSWQDGAARVSYRGAEWDAVPESPQTAATGTLVIKAVRGSTLVLGPPI